MPRVRIHRKTGDTTKVEQGLAAPVIDPLGPMQRVTAETLSSSALRLSDEPPLGTHVLSAVRRSIDDPTGTAGGPKSYNDAPESRFRDFPNLVADVLYRMTSTPIAIDGTVGPSTSVEIRTAKASLTGTRDPLLQPFSKTSIWNIPIGSGAITKDAGIRATPHPDQIYADTFGQSSKVVIDPIYITMDPAQPLKTISGSSLNFTIPSGTQVHVDPILAHNGSYNGICAFLRPGGKTYMEGQPLTLAAGGNPSWKYTNPKTTDADLRSEGRAGMHGGAQMSGLGGAIRRKEWDEYASKPLRHVLSINLFGVRFMSRGVHPQGGGGWRWPAYRADSGFDNSASKNYYGLTDPSMPMMGALVCLPETFDLAKVTHPRARWLAEGLRGMGAYVVDNTAWDAHAFSMEKSVSGLFRNENATFHAEVMALFSALHIVTNNSSTNVGGGGTPRVSPPPDLVAA